MGDHTRVRRIEGKKYAAKEDQKSVDRQAPKCDEGTDREMRLGAEKIVRLWLTDRQKRIKSR